MADGATVGYLAQEPYLDPAKDVMGNVMDGVADKKAILDRYNELMMNYSDETADEGAEYRMHEFKTSGTSNRKLRWRWKHFVAHPATAK